MTLLFGPVATATPMKGKLLNCLPGMRWIPHDIPSQEAPQRSRKEKTRSRFGRRASEPDHGAKARRKSTISLTSVPDPELDARTHAQSQSPFFSMLPIEVRKIVYEYVMGEETVHLTMGSKKRMGHFVCETDVEGQEAIECRCRVLVGGRESGRLSSACLRILRVCRRMYSEAVPHLYNPHTFSLLHVTHLLYLPSRVPQQRLNSIRTLRLRWAIRALPHLRRGPAKRIAYPEDTANWAKGWEIIAGMEGLKDLYVVLIDPSRDDMWERQWLELEGTLLEPVKSVTRPRWFELMLPYASCNSEWNMGQSKVTLRKPEGDDEEEEDEQ